MIDRQMDSTIPVPLNLQPSSGVRVSLSGKNPAPSKKCRLLSADKLPDQLQLRN
jgi:hypothetical protein